MSAPVRFKIDHPTKQIQDWTEIASLWMKLNACVDGNPDFSPLTVKGAYVIGTIHGICQSVSWMLQAPNQLRDIIYIPAYGVFVSAIELLGRCINGNDTERNNTQDIKTGFKYLVSSAHETIQDNHILIVTSHSQYSIDNLTSLRHFAAHGQAASQFVRFDNEILEKMPPLLADALERYWNELQRDEDLCDRLARAKVLAIRGVPVYLSWSLFERDSSGVYHSMTEIFNRFNWVV